MYVVVREPRRNYNYTHFAFAKGSTTGSKEEENHVVPMAGPIREEISGIMSSERLAILR